MWKTFSGAPPPDNLVILDLHLTTQWTEREVLQGPLAIKELSGLGYRVCLYTNERRLLVIAQCLAAGAIGLVRKCDSMVANQQAFIRLADGETVVPGSLVGLAELLSRRERLPELTKRQREVLSARARGETWEALGRRLNISAKTAYDHLEAVMNKMVWYLGDVGLSTDASPADIERALGLAPGDLNG